MKRHTITLPMLIFIAVLLVSMAVFPTAASGTAGEPDAVAGSGAALSLARQSETFDIIASAHNGGLVSPQRFGLRSRQNRLFQRGPLQRI